jgi:hypothetical protein
MRNFAEIGCIFATYRKKPEKKDGFPEFGVFRMGTTFPEIFRFIPITLILPVYLLRRACSVKTPKCKLFRISILKSGKFSEISRFFSGFLFPEFPNFGKSDQIRNLQYTLLKWHITLRFNEKPKNRGFPGTFPVTSSREKFSEKCRGMRHGRIENTPRIEGTRVCAAGF